MSSAMTSSTFFAPGGAGTGWSPGTGCTFGGGGAYGDGDGAGGGGGGSGRPVPEIEWYGSDERGAPTLLFKRQYPLRALSLSSRVQPTQRGFASQRAQHFVTFIGGLWLLRLVPPRPVSFMSGAHVVVAAVTMSGRNAINATSGRNAASDIVRTSRARRNSSNSSSHF